MPSKRQLDADIATALAQPAPVDGKQPLYGHTSETTAFHVADYPYGFRERTEIRYWLEANPKKGWRLVSQTRNPKTGAWNKPKPSTYADWGAAMYLDENGHVQWEGVGPYSNARKFLDFVRAFPGADLSVIRKVVPAKIRHLDQLLTGQAFFTVNGVRQPRSEAEDEDTRQELQIWQEISNLLGMR